MLRTKLMDPTSAKFANALSDIEDRHNDIIKLEKVNKYLNYIETF
jgi:hypothetical protein